MIKIINYGLGNVNSFLNIYKSLGINCEVSNTEEGLKGATKLILPGVGSFDWAIKKLNKSGMRDTLEKLVTEKKIPILGVCVGMQIMAKSSEEGKEPGLNWINAKNIHLSKILQEQKLPHMGWNNIDSINSKILEGLDSPRFYFLHSYFIQTENEREVIAYTKYGKKFPCAISNQNIFGVQFHPEKSHSWGIKVLENFAKFKE